MKKSHLLSELYICLFTFISLSASAASIDIGATDGGWYRSDGFHNADNKNYIAGEVGGFEHRNWFAFDLSSVSLQAGEIITGGVLGRINAVFPASQRVNVRFVRDRRATRLVTAAKPA